MDSNIFYFTEDQGSNPVRFEPDKRFANGQVLAVFIHRDKVYTHSAVSFGQFSSRDKNKALVGNTRKMMEIFGKLCDNALRSPFGRTAKDNAGKTYPRYQTYIREIPYADGRQSADGKPFIGWIIWLVYNYVGDERENPGADFEKEQDIKRVRDRNFVRNPVWAFGRSLHEAHGGRGDPVHGQVFKVDPHPSKVTAAAAKKQFWIDKAKKSEIIDAFMLYGRGFNYTDAMSKDLWASYNQANPFYAMGIDRACELAVAVGADPDYCIPDCYRGTVEFPDSGERQWAIRLEECLPQRLFSTFFPHHPRPEYEIDEEFREYMQTRHMDPTLDDPQFALIAANASVRLGIQRVLLSDADTQSLNGVRAYVDSLYQRKLVPMSGASIEEKAAMKLEIQRLGMDRMRTVMHPDGNLPNALKAICRAEQDILDNSPYGNFCKPIPRQFRNLTALGEGISHILLALEKTMGVHSLHRECLIAMMCSRHIHFEGRFHPHPLFLGDPMTGKSMIIKFLQGIMVDGTYCITDHMSAQAFMAEDNRDLDEMLLCSEEGEPSAVGYTKPGDRRGGGDMAMTDKASAIRALMTSMEMHWMRMGQNKETGAFERQAGKAKTNVIFCWAMNLSSGDLAANSRSRWVCIPISVRERPSSSIQGKIISSTGYAKTPEYKMFKERMQRDQVVVAKMAKFIGTRISDDINRTVTDIWFTEATNKATTEGLAGAADIRNFEKARMLVDVLCVHDALWQYYDSGMPGCKDHKEPHKDDDWLALSKLFVTNMQHLVLAMTLIGAQFEDPVMWETIEAINRLLGNGLAQKSKYFAVDPKAAAEEKKKKNKDKNKNKPGLKQSTIQQRQEEKKEEKKGEEGGLGWQSNANPDQKAQPAASQPLAQAQLHSAWERMYFESDWTDRMANMTDPQRCDALAERIRPLMTAKHSLAHVKHFIHSLYNDTVKDPDFPGVMRAAIAWSDGKGPERKMRIAKKTLSNNKQNRMLSILEEVVNRDGMPAIEMITGIPEPGVPFLMQTIKTAAAKELERKGGDAEPSDFGAFNMSLSSELDAKHSSPPTPERKRKPYLIRNHRWVDRSVALAVHRATTFNIDEGQRNESMQKSFNDLFREPYLQIDCDFETFAAYENMNNTCTTFSTLNELGFGTAKEAERVIVPDERYKLYAEKAISFQELLSYPEAFKSREPTYLNKERWSKRPRDSSDSDSDIKSPVADKRARNGEAPEESADSLDQLHGTHHLANLSADLNRMRGNIDPSYKESKEYRQYEDQANEIFRKTQEIHTNLTRTVSDGSMAPSLWRTRPRASPRASPPPPAPALVQRSRTISSPQREEEEEEEREEKREEQEEEEPPADVLADEDAALAEENEDDALLDELNRFEKPEEEQVVDEDDEQTRDGYERPSLSILFRKR